MLTCLKCCCLSRLRFRHYSIQFFLIQQIHNFVFYNWLFCMILNIEKREILWVKVNCCFLIILYIFLRLYFVPELKIVIWVLRGVYTFEYVTNHTVIGGCLEGLKKDSRPSVALMPRDSILFAVLHTFI